MFPTSDPSLEKVRSLQQASAHQGCRREARAGPPFLTTGDLLVLPGHRATSGAPGHLRGGSWLRRSRAVPWKAEESPQGAQSSRPRRQNPCCRDRDTHLLPQLWPRWWPLPGVCRARGSALPTPLQRQRNPPVCRPASAGCDSRRGRLQAQAQETNWKTQPTRLGIDQAAGNTRSPARGTPALGNWRLAVTGMKELHHWKNCF